VSLLEIQGLGAYIDVRGGTARAVDGVDLVVEEGEAVGLVGESGSGKTMLALSILGLLPAGSGRLLPGSSIRLRGKELVRMDRKGIRKVRGGEIAMIFQEPMTSLNPVYTVGNQIQEAVELHKPSLRGASWKEALRLLEEVGIPDSASRAKHYPHQLSGGMRQRAMIAMALAGDPSLLVADEPTTALDVTTEVQILNLLKGAQARLGMGMLLISHDLGVVSRICDRVVILYGGKVVEAGPTSAVLGAPKHPYTRGRMGSRLSLDDRRGALRPIPGEVPEATDWPVGCRFHPRCSEVSDQCRVREPDLSRVGEWTTRCWLFPQGKGNPDG